MNVTPIELVRILEAAERRWFRTKTRARWPDGERLWRKKYFMVRAVSLIPRWRRLT